MPFLHYVDSPKGTEQWLIPTPDLTKLLPTILRHHEIHGAPDQDITVSVYEAAEPLSELATVAALYVAKAKGKSAVEKCFGLRVEERDWKEVGIRAEMVNEGGTGVPSIDERHVNLTGNKGQFRQLIFEILKAIWAGEDRIRYFPAMQIAGQIAVMATLKGALPAGTSELYRAVTERTGCCRILDNPGRVEIYGKLRCEETEESVVAVRTT